MGPSMSLGCGCFSSSSTSSCKCPTMISKALHIDKNFQNLSPESVSMASSFKTINHSNNSNDSSVSASPSKLSIKDFAVQKQLGKGASGKVLLVSKKNKKSDLYAMKIIRKADVYEGNLLSNMQVEKSVLTKAENPFIVNMHYSFQTPTKIYFVLEFLSGGDLFNLLHKMRKFNLNTAKFFLAEVILAVEYLHNEMNLIYRDLKPENILLKDDGHIKITDFGLAKYHQNNCVSFVGTPEYAAPEIILNTPQTKAVDIWSIGILLYEMIAGFTPFMSTKKDNSEVQKKIIEGNLSFPSHFDDTTKELIKSLLMANPLERMTIEDIKRHKFFEDIEWEKVRKLQYKPPIKMNTPKFNEREQVELKESYDLNTLPDLEGLSYNNEGRISQMTQ